MKFYLRGLCLLLSAITLFFALSWTQVAAAGNRVQVTAMDNSNPLREFADQVFGSGTSDQVEGKIDQASGELQQASGEAIDDPEMQVEGQAKQMEGKVQEALGSLKDQADQAGNQVEEAVQS